MATPKVSWQQHRYLGQWNMRQSLMASPYKAEEPHSPSIIECYRQIKANRKNEQNKNWSASY
jgi:hypothetical protein